MEENQNENNIKHEEKPKHSLMKTILVGILIFLGAFCAFYVVVDWHLKTIFTSNPRHIERMIEKDMKSMDKLIQHENKMFKHAPNIIRMEQTPDLYKIIIDLKAFDNDANNVKINSDGKVLSISAQAIKKSKHNEQISEFQQNFLFGETVKLENLTKETIGNLLIIRIPIDNKSE